MGRSLRPDNRTNGKRLRFAGISHDFRSANHRATPSPLNRIQRRSVSGGGDRVSCRFYYLTYYSIVPFFRQEKGQRILAGKCNWAWEIFQEVPRAHMQQEAGPASAVPAHSSWPGKRAPFALSCAGLPWLPLLFQETAPSCTFRIFYT